MRSFFRLLTTWIPLIPLGPNLFSALRLPSHRARHCISRATSDVVVVPTLEFLNSVPLYHHRPWVRPFGYDPSGPTFWIQPAFFLQSRVSSCKLGAGVGWEMLGKLSLETLIIVTQQGMTRTLDALTCMVILSSDKLLLRLVWTQPLCLHFFFSFILVRESPWSIWSCLKWIAFLHRWRLLWSNLTSEQNLQYQTPETCVLKGSASGPENSQHCFGLWLLRIRAFWLEVRKSRVQLTVL